MANENISSFVWSNIHTPKLPRAIVSLLTILEEIFLIWGSLGYAGVLKVTLLISLIIFLPLHSSFDYRAAKWELRSKLDGISVLTLGRTTVFLSSYNEKKKRSKH